MIWYIIWSVSLNVPLHSHALTNLVAWSMKTRGLSMCVVVVRIIHVCCGCEDYPCVLWLRGLSMCVVVARIIHVCCGCEDYPCVAPCVLWLWEQQINYHHRLMTLTVWLYKDGNPTHCVGEITSELLYPEVRDNIYSTLFNIQA